MLAAIGATAAVAAAVAAAVMVAAAAELSDGTWYPATFWVLSILSAVGNASVGSLPSCLAVALLIPDVSTTKGVLALEA
jgi:hypothetical protein